MTYSGKLQDQVNQLAWLDRRTLVQRRADHSIIRKWRGVDWRAKRAQWEYQLPDCPVIIVINKQEQQQRREARLLVEAT
jgi:hypothetical protein